MQRTLDFLLLGVNVEHSFPDDVYVPTVLLGDFLHVLWWYVELERNEVSLFVHQTL